MRDVDRRQVQGVLMFLVITFKILQLFELHCLISTVLDDVAVGGLDVWCEHHDRGILRD